MTSLKRISTWPFARGRDRRTAAFAYAYPYARFAAALTFAFASFATGCGTPESDPTPVVEDLTYRLLPGGARIISGSVHNPSGEHVQNVQVQVSLFDAANTRIGSMSILVQDIAAGERVAFRQAVDSDLDVQAARVRGIIVM